MLNFYFSTHSLNISTSCRALWRGEIPFYYLSIQRGRTIIRLLGSHFNPPAGTSSLKSLCESSTSSWFSEHGEACHVLESATYCAPEIVILKVTMLTWRLLTSLTARMIFVAVWGGGAPGLYNFGSSSRLSKRVASQQNVKASSELSLAAARANDQVTFQSNSSYRAICPTSI
jgi:hypothetical protein